MIQPVRNLPKEPKAEIEATDLKQPKLRTITIERSKNEVVRFNGIPFKPIEPTWTALYRLDDDPVVYWVTGIKASSQRQAHSFALMLLRQKGIDIRKD